MRVDPVGECFFLNSLIFICREIRVRVDSEGMNMRREVLVELLGDQYYKIK